MNKNSINKGFRFWLAFYAGRLTAFICRLFRLSGTSLPGAVALRICPQLLFYLAPAYEKVIAVTGTNGKTTTTNLISYFLRQAGVPVIGNGEGANMINGVVTALIKDCNFFGAAQSRTAVLEVDEGSVGKILPAVKPDLIVVTNYFRDQLDRYSELDHIIALLRKTIDHLPETELLLNADDPLAVAVGRGRTAVRYYGVAGERDCKELEENEIREGGFCPDCGELLTYDYYQYCQLGDYRCTKCSFKRPEPDFLALDVDDSDLLHFSLYLQNKNTGEQEPQKGNLDLHSQLRGFYNVYNILAASAAAMLIGVPQQIIERSLPDYSTATGRLEQFIYQGRPCTLGLIKNPIGVNEVIKTILPQEGKKAFLIAINDLAGDGKDVSWLWDADFEKLDQSMVSKVVCSGRRAAEIAVRLKYAGFTASKIVLEPGCRESLDVLGLQKADQYYILASYTSLFNYAKLLRKRGKAVAKNADQSLPSLS
ncbi:MAG: MurT ligase domain-containing protein [Thermacetogeniaceae bacterium]|nr:DUF1727 domain-containing protein [Syntrophomonadaceae bacterium]